MKMCLKFAYYASKGVQCSNEIMFHSHMRFGDKVMWWPECVQPPPLLRKNHTLVAQLKSPFGDFCNT